MNVIIVILLFLALILALKALWLVADEIADYTSQPVGAWDDPGGQVFEGA